jgi:hypothetical protein
MAKSRYFPTNLQAPAMTIFRFAPIVAALTLAAFAPLSFAQYVWTDDKGGKQFSDMPPPPNIPKNRILKQPGAKAPTEQEPTTAPSASAPNSASAPAAAKGPMTTAERNADFNKRRMEQAEKEKKTAQETEKQAALAKNCERARAYSRTLESGQRIANTDSSGERNFMSDEQRGKELRDTQRVLGDCK